MKKAYTRLVPASLLGILLLAGACQRRDLRGEEVSIQQVSISIRSDGGQLVVPTDSNYSRTVSSVVVPIRMTFSDAVPKRFNVDVSANDDTVTGLIASGKLPDAVLLPSQYYTLPHNVDVPFGVDHMDFNLTVDITPIERNYGKDLVLAVSLSDPTKANQLDAGKKTCLIVIHTDKVVALGEIHYVYFARAGALAGIPDGTQIYSQNSTSLTVPVKVSLAGVAGDAFKVKAMADADTVTRALSDGVLDPDSVIALKPQDDFQVDDSIVSFDANKNEATFNVTVNVSALKDHLDKKLALGLVLTDPTAHLLDTTRDRIILLLDPPRLVESDFTNDGSVLSVQYENNSATDTAEYSPHLVDNNINSKYLIFNFTAPAWIQLKFTQPHYGGAYTMTSANDSPQRDPTAWQLLGSNNGITWTVLDTRSGEVFTDRFQTKKYTFSNSTAYSYYRLNITAIGSGDLYQQAEWRLIHRP